MPELPSYIEEHMNESILGRAKLKLYKLVSGKTNWLPAYSEVLRFTRKEFRQNPAAGKVFFTLFTENLLKRVKFSELLQAENAAQLLRRLEQKPLSHQSVLEVSDCPEPLSKVLGVCIHRENLADEGYVYVVTLFDDKSFPEAISGRMEVRACSTKPEPMFSVWSGSGYEHFSETNYHESWWADFAIKLLSHLDNDRPLTVVPISRIDQAEFSDDNVYTPPEDKQLTAYIVDVLQSESSCTRATVPLETVKPFSLDFCLTYPIDIVEWDIKQIQKGNVTPMVVYWKEDHFIMSDDYPAYLAHRTLKSESVPVVIVGEFPRHVVVGDVTVGGSELIPPIGIVQRPNYDLLPPQIKDWLIDIRLHHKEISSSSAWLAAVAMVLSEMLSKEAIDEKEIHEFLAQYPIIVDPHGSSMKSELKLGGQYRVDLAIQYTLDEKKLLLIELEHPRASIFTAKGRPRSHVTHAIQQVEDWLQWWREHPKDVPKGFDSTIPVQGLVVIGRNKNLTERDKRRLLHLNSTRDVKLITYDELLEKLEILIQNLESLE
jgi:hypothetical protein